MLLWGCGSRYEIAPKIEELKGTKTITASATNTSSFMLKYLPESLKNGISDLKFQYDFIYDNNALTGFDGVNLLNPLVIVGFLLSCDDFKMIANLKIFNLKDEIKFSSICVVRHARIIF